MMHHYFNAKILSPILDYYTKAIYMLTNEEMKSCECRGLQTCDVRFVKVFSGFIVTDFKQANVMTVH